MNPILVQALKTAVPGHKGTVVGSEADMIRRTLEQSRIPRLRAVTKWDPDRATYITKHYLPDGTAYNAMTLKIKMSS